MFEDNHRQNALLIQNLPTRTPKPAALTLLGWQSLRSFIAYLKVMFMLRVLCLSNESIYKKLMVASIDVFQEQGDRRILTPVGDIMQYVKQYGFSDIVHRCRIAGTWKMIDGLKKNVKACILTCDENLWKASCMLYRCLDIYNESVLYKKMNVWWTFVAKNSGAFKCTSSVVALLCGTQPNGLGANFGSRVRCQICSAFAIETFTHTVFECEGIIETRRIHLSELYNVMPAAMRISFCELSNQEKLTFILSGLGCKSYIKDWQDIYLKASVFIHKVYRERARQYTAFDIG